MKLMKDLYGRSGENWELIKLANPQFINSSSNTNEKYEIVCSVFYYSTERSNSNGWKLTLKLKLPGIWERERESRKTK